MIRAFVTGFPIKHSKSPLLHGYWLDENEIGGTYEALEIAPQNFKKFLSQMLEQGFAGGNVTIPHKEKACQLVSKLDNAAKSIGAVNTLWIEDGELWGGNTDAYGFATNLDDYANDWRHGNTAIVLGAGGASRAVIYAILEAGFSQVYIINRTLSRAQNLAQRFGEKCSANAWEALPDLIRDCDLLVNTTSLGMSGQGESQETPMPDLSLMKKTAIVTDIVYAPLETPILKSAKENNLKTVDGLGMLLHQAVPGFQKWFGIRPQVSVELREKILGANN